MAETKAFQVFQSGLNIRIFNKTFLGNHTFDTKIFWEHLDGNRNKVIKYCISKGFTNLDDCLDNCSKYIKKYKENNPIIVEKIDVISHDKN